jgi:DNA-binding HxlR family transcriptional regulator
VVSKIHLSDLSHGRAGALLGDRWILLILREATLGVRRFDEFRERDAECANGKRAC